MLWPPNRKVYAPAPLCKRCGGFRKGWLNRNRHHAGFSFHRACCCIVCGGFSNISITFTDIVACVGCFKPNSYAQWQSFNCNATFNSFSLVRDFPTECQFQGTVCGVIESYGVSDSTCSGTPSLWEAIPDISLYKADGSISRLNISGTISGRTFESGLISQGNKFSGDSIANTKGPCPGGTNDVIATGGTGIATYDYNP